uniref:RRP15-like protein n=1 Tax=Steinernema glaseri TaxID=37863 RepID=A0A1I7YWT8_9BILA
MSTDKIVVNDGSSSSEDEEVQEVHSSDENGELSASSGEEDYVDEPTQVVSFDKERRVVKNLSKRQLALKVEETRAAHKMAMVKPDLVKDREKERHLARVATKGVVQLFNAVTQRQGEMDKLFSEKKGKGKREATEKLDKLKPENFRKKLKGDDAKQGQIKPEEADELPDDLKFLLDGSGLGREYMPKDDVKEELSD